MKNKTFKKRKKHTNTCYIAPHKHNHAKKKAVNHPPLKTLFLCCSVDFENGAI